GLGLDETLRYCMAIFEGEDLDVGQVHAIRSRREVVQHAAAFHYIVDQFVTKDQPMSETLICNTHALLVKDVSGEGAGFYSIKAFGGQYRSARIFTGAQELTRPTEIPKAMASLVKNLANDLEQARKDGVLDPFTLAAKYADRFVNIHPFRDGNGRVCRLILNAILIKYAGIVVNVGEHDSNREQYLNIATESTKVGGHAGALGTLVLHEATKTFRRMRDMLKKK
ncbi:Fic-domain-containing protein, partial [Massarina eburnea CBS 473.64]